MSDRDLMQQALEALESLFNGQVDAERGQRCASAATALRERLAQPEQEMVPLKDYKDLSALCTRQGIRLMELEDAQPEQEPVPWEDVLGAIARGWTHDDNKHKTMDVQLAVAIAKEIQDMVIAPPHRKPLTDKQIGAILEDPNIAEPHQGNWLVLPYAYARAIEAAHGIKGS